MFNDVAIQASSCQIVSYKGPAGLHNEPSVILRLIREGMREARMNRESTRVACKVLVNNSIRAVLQTGSWTVRSRLVMQFRAGSEGSLQRTSKILLLCFFALGHLWYQQTAATAQSTDVVTTHNALRLTPVRTESPRATFETLLSVRDQLEEAIGRYHSKRSSEFLQHIVAMKAQLSSLIDLSAVPRATRNERGTETAMYILDILGRIDLPDPESIPDLEAVSDEIAPVSWRIPNSPLRIIGLNEGARQGEFLFSQLTVSVAPRFFQSLEDLPLRSRPDFDSWNAMDREITGPLIPIWLVNAVPDNMHGLWLDTPAWKLVLVSILAAVVLIVAVVIFRILRRIRPQTNLGRLRLQLLMPIAVLFALKLLIPIMTREINLSGQASDLGDFIRTTLDYLAWAWLFWVAIRAVFEVFIGSPKIQDESFDANMLRLISRIVGTFGVILLLAYGGQDLGLPVMSLVAGLGIGGLAVALAIRPTLENLIGGFVLYMDKPVKVGDFCSFGGEMGTVESIGIRSTQLRARDRTLITVPNAQFADMQLINWAQCDQMLIAETIGVRYETSPDQLRYLLARIRELAHGHPRIDSNTVRVRFVGYGDSSLNIGIRIYAKTIDWNDFFAIREDVFLRICDLVVEAGTSFAFPSQTLYFGRDDGLDQTARDAALSQVNTWRRSGQLPFPHMTEEQLEELEGTVDYPPKGSPEAGREGQDGEPHAERFSGAPVEKEQGTENKKRPATENPMADR